MELYETSDLHLASYLRASGLRYKSVKKIGEGSDGKQMKCSFVFEVPDSVSLGVTLKLRNEQKFVQDVLQKSSQLKSELKRFFMSEEK